MTKRPCLACIHVTFPQWLSAMAFAPGSSCERSEKEEGAWNIKCSRCLAFLLRLVPFSCSHLLSCVCRCRTNICPLLSYKILMEFSCDLARIEVAVVSSSWLVWTLHLEFCRRSPVAERMWLSREFYYSNAKPSIVIVNCQPWWKLACSR